MVNDHHQPDLPGRLGYNDQQYETSHYYTSRSASLEVSIRSLHCQWFCRSVQPCISAPSVTVEKMDINFCKAASEVSNRPLLSW